MIYYLGVGVLHMNVQVLGHICMHIYGDQRAPCSLCQVPSTFSFLKTGSVTVIQLTNYVWLPGQQALGFACLCPSKSRMTVIPPCLVY